MGVNDFRFWVVTWTPQVCRIIAFYLLLGHILPTFGGLGRRFWNCWASRLGLGLRGVRLIGEKQQARWSEKSRKLGV